ncbi:MAG: GNAT family N-acetyltransferase [Gammaproteobacteria bacterium]|nr:GNAT family N-acetyltransferase [Gammaproteobacteria bacterium]NVK87876.1 GNAT family N-acetyltransferase [Gammaproteobacteria bacterium]
MSHTLNIAKATSDNQLKAIEALAETIWAEHYTPIIGAAQVSYMLEKFQSYPAMKHQIEQENTLYFQLHALSELVGYFAVKPTAEHLFLSKLYLASNARGQGFAKQALDFIKRLANEHGLSTIVLTVNKYNHLAINAYQALGFENVAEVVADIGNGYIMDDFRLELHC